MRWAVLLIGLSEVLNSGMDAANPMDLSQLSETERIEWLRPYLSPAPGDMTRLDPEAIKNRTKISAWKLKGFISVTPPKGQCWTIQRSDRHRSIRVCSHDRISWQAEDIDENGVLSWWIQTHPKDPGFTYKWPTPHRIAQVIAADSRTEEGFGKELILSCEALTLPRRQIILTLGNAQTWKITLPAQDTPISQSTADPNLYIRGAETGWKDGKPIDMPRDKDLSYLEARKKAHLKEDVRTYWTLSDKDAYVMSAQDFYVSDHAPGNTGICRYRKARNLDKDLAYMECHNTMAYDVVYFPAPCLADLISKDTQQ